MVSGDLGGQGGPEDSLAAHGAHTGCQGDSQETGGRTQGKRIYIHKLPIHRIT